MRPNAIRRSRISKSAPWRWSSIGDCEFLSIDVSVRKVEDVYVGDIVFINPQGDIIGDVDSSPQFDTKEEAMEWCERRLGL